VDASAMVPVGPQVSTSRIRIHVDCIGLAASGRAVLLLRIKDLALVTNRT
jgi:hypothetical protein